VETQEKSDGSLEMDRFRAALKRMMQVSKEDLKEILAQEKAANADKPKRGPKSHHKPREA
jgi:hypothetical protein